MIQRSLPVVLALMAFTPVAAADGPAAPPPAVAAPQSADATKAAIEKQRLRFAAVMRPELRTRVLAAARVLAQRLDASVSPNVRPPDAQQLARQIVSDGQSFPGLSLGASDIEALAFIVLMEATRSADDDLKSIMSQIKAVDAAKACLRASLDRAKARQCMDGITPTPPMTQIDLDAFLAGAKSNPSSLDTLGSTESLRLQMAMDRMSKLMTTLSNVLKKISDTDSSIVQNLK